MEVIPASHGVSGLVFLKLGIIKKKLKLSKEVFEEENNIYYHEEDYKKVRSRNFITLIPFPSIRRMKVNYSGFKFENFYQILEKENSCLVFTYPIKLKLGRFTSYSCCEFADNKILCWRIFFSELFLSKVFLRHSIPHYCLKCRCKVKYQ